MLKIDRAHNSSINGIEFDKSHELIISCSHDNAIKFFNRKDGKL